MHTEAVPPLHRAGWAIAFALGLILCAFTASEISRLPDGRLHVAFLDVGQGDATLIRGPGGETILIDGGPDLSALERIGTLLPFFQRTIDLVVLSHPDLDHISALPALLDRYDVKRVLLAGTEHAGGPYQELLDALERHHTPVLLPDQYFDLAFADGLTLDVVWPPTGATLTAADSTNSSSIVLRALYGSSAILFTGDIDEATEAKILASGADIRSTVLKVPHHGSAGGSSTGFLLAVRPEVAVVSVARVNRYGLPAPATMDRYRRFGIPVRSTAQEGTVELSF